MATTTYLGITKLEVGQKEKEVTLNTGLDAVDAESSRLNDEVNVKPEHLGDVASDPSSTGVIPGSTYYNTSTFKLKFLRQDGTTWTNAA